MNDTEKRLAEAIELLDLWYTCHGCYGEVGPATRDFLESFRAPAQPAAPEPETFTQLAAQVFNGWPAAPEPSAEPHGTGISRVDAEKGALRLAEGFAEQRDRAETAESKLAAVRAACLKVCPDGHGSVHISTAVLWPLLTPAGPNGGAK